MSAPGRFEPGISAVQLSLLCVVILLLGIFIVDARQGMQRGAYDVMVLAAPLRVRAPGGGIPVVTVLADDRVLLNGAEVPGERLVVALQQRLRAAPGPLVILDADDRLSYQQVIGVIDTVRRAGGQAVVSRTEP